SAALHGMPVACLMGRCHPRLTVTTCPRPVLSPGQIQLVGVRSFEPEEVILAATMGVSVITTAELRHHDLAQLLAKAAGDGPFGVSLDLDAIDPTDAPGVGTPVGGGIGGHALLAALTPLLALPRCLGLEIAEFNPHHDIDHRTAALVEALIGAALQARRPVMTKTIELENRWCAHNYQPLPVVLVRGLGAEVWDEDGRRYIDMMGCYSAVSFGHGHPRILKALTEQASKLAVVSRAYHTAPLGPFLELACRLTGMDGGLPMNTGAEAVETALKAARKWAYTVKMVPPGQARIIACRGNFHGRTIAIIGMSTVPQYRDGFGPYPLGFDLVPFGDAPALERAITPDTAAFLVEPIQGEGGIIVPPPGYLARCRQICDANRVLLITDEIQTGLGRTGTILAADHDGIRPDAVTLGKALGGGLLPVSLFLARREVIDVFKPGDHGSTFGGNPLAAAVGREALIVLQEERLSERAADLGGWLMDRLRRLSTPLIKEVRGRGLFIGIEFDPALIKADTVCQRLAARGILTKDTHRNTIRFAPPLVISRDQLAEAVEALRLVLDEKMAA
ncbi:MAG: ornithine--oxo-acid transaminase, partial [Magnetospirillum sp.]